MIGFQIALPINVTTGGFMKNILLLIPLLAFLGCDPKKSTVKANVQSGVPTNGQAAASTNIAGDFTLSNQCPQGVSGIGSIWDSGGTAESLYTSSGSFEDRVKALLSASIAASGVGQISGLESDSTGLRFQGVVKLDAAGNVVAANSKMLIKVYDSFVGQPDSNGVKSEPIKIDFISSKAQISGQINMQTGQGYVSFSDSYGEVRFEGRLDAQFFTGLVKFQNAKNVNEGAPAGDTLGQFKVARCGIIQ